MELDALRIALAASPDNVPLLLLVANACIDQFSLDEAQNYFERVIALDRRQPEARTGIAHVLNLKGRGSEAILRLEQVCQESPRHAPAWLLRAKLILAEGNASEARSHYEQAVALDATLADADLVTRIDQAGGRADSSRRNGGRIRPQAAGDSQAGAYYDPDDENEEEDEDFFLDPDEESDAEMEREFVQKADISFAQVGGMDRVKEDIRMKILYPMQNKDLFAAYGKKAGGGVLLYGPPGCGKTLISRATAGEIKAKFLSIGLHQILDMWIGKSEEKLHEIFALARRNAPCVLFFDEVDALAADRKDMRTSAGRTLINQFLAEMDGTSGSNDGLLVLGATNAPWHLDSAFLRPGRFDRILFVPPPDEPAREEIIRLLSEGKPTTGIDAAALARKTKDFSGADLKAVFDQSIETALTEAMKTGKIVPVTQKELLLACKQVKPSTRKWFESAKNYALYANQSGFYDDILEYLGLKK
ncbi:MAG: AAA family ATPase [Verrucomicrobiales bacterium]